MIKNNHNTFLYYMYEKKNWKNNMDTFFGNLSQHVNGISYNIG